MRKSSKLILVGGAIAALAVPSAAMAAAPNGDYTTTLHEGAQVTSNASSIGQQSSAIKQNGQFVSGNGKSNPLNIPDQTTEPGSRADLVQHALGH
jgi:hypothetical protein